MIMGPKVLWGAHKFIPVTVLALFNLAGDGWVSPALRQCGESVFVCVCVRVCVCQGGRERPSETETER